MLHSCRSSLLNLIPPKSVFAVKPLSLLSSHCHIPSSFIHTAPIPLIKYIPCSAATPCQASDKRGTDGEWEGGVKGSPKSRSPSYTICSASVETIEIYYLAAIIALISSLDFCRGGGALAVFYVLYISCYQLYPAGLSHLSHPVIVKGVIPALQQLIL